MNEGNEGDEDKVILKPLGFMDRHHLYEIFITLKTDLLSLSSDACAID